MLHPREGDVQTHGAGTWGEGGHGQTHTVCIISTLNSKLCLGPDQLIGHVKVLAHHKVLSQGMS